MTQAEFKKAKRYLSDFNTVRVVLIMRLLATALSFATVVFMVIWISVVASNGGSEETVKGYIESMWLLFAEAFGFTTLKIGAYGYFIIPNMSLAVGIIAFVVGFVITILLFKAFKKTKESAGHFVWFILIGLLDLVVTYLIWDVAFVNNDMLVDGVYCYLVQIVSFILCFRAMSCASYLNAHFEKGSAMKMRELYKIYNETASEE